MAPTARDVLVGYDGSLVVGVDSSDFSAAVVTLHDHTATVTGCFAARQRKAAGTPGERGRGVRPALS